MKKIYLLSILLFFAILVLFQACKEDEMPGQVSLEFSHKVNGNDIRFDSLLYMAKAEHLFSIIRLKYYVSDFQLIGMDGSVFSVPAVHYRDATIDNTKTFILKDVPPGNYSTLIFTFGLSEEKNIKGALPNTTTNINMEWPIPGDDGYHYMKFEGKYQVSETGEVKSFNLHTGATKGNRNYFVVSLPLSRLGIDGDGHTIGIEMDLMEWLQNPITYDFELFGPMIMANQEAQEILKSNGGTVFKVASVE